ncbi:hypothetical protein [Streptomyces griseocarneus]|uniref:hypothetical protein n=1 Tax=Streptomyces griseocarneus TaxID=51201 RepID=UPI00167E70D2|nr:hypothetical protein [Streptomyces griseocarneus]MBZ6475044.1 hypothetical protein [Streptomyces griseocarneus]
MALALAAGAGCWAGGIGPFKSKDRYCWGAWEQDSGPMFLGEKAFYDGGTRTAAETAPSSRDPRGTCTVTVHAESAGSRETIRYEDRVTVSYGVIPGPAAARTEWLGEFLQGESDRLPDDLPGMVGADRGVFVLPKECDVDGRPAAVTLRTRSTGVSASGTSHTIVPTLDKRDIAKMLLAAADHGMRKAGCAPARTPRLASPFPPEETEKARTERKSPMRWGVCDIKGLHAGDGESLAWSQTGADKRLQICSATAVPGADAELAGQFIAVNGLPRLEALFDGMTDEGVPATGWRGKAVLGKSTALVRADCGDKKAVFFQYFSEKMSKAAGPGPERVFANGANAAAKRAGCAPVAPTD